MTCNSEGKKGSGWALSSRINYGAVPGQWHGSLAVSDKSKNTKSTQLSIKKHPGTSLLVQGLRLRVPKAGAGVQSLVRELDAAWHS